MKTVEQSIESIESSLLQFAIKLESQNNVLTQQYIDFIDYVNHVLSDIPDDDFPF
ncbi:hypothetical protein [Shewanella algae]|uniref:hypothetical protein n=1 Tax=Shewanella algae TaxID=38313 RepID=UPI0031F574AA